MVCSRLVGQRTKSRAHIQQATFASPFLLPLADDAVRRPSLLPCRVARARDAQSEQLYVGVIAEAVSDTPGEAAP